MKHLILPLNVTVRLGLANWVLLAGSVITEHAANQEPTVWQHSNVAQKRVYTFFLHGNIAVIPIAYLSNHPMQKKVYTLFWQHLSVARRRVPPLLGARISLTL